MALSGRQFTIRAGEHEATVVEVGAGLRRYTCRGGDVTLPYAEDELSPKGCGAVLVPWPNRLRGGRFSFGGHEYQVPITEPGKGNANHGLGRWARWRPIATTESSVALALEIVPQSGWPFEVTVEVTYALDADTGLAVSALARNVGATDAPFGAGFHPYLAVGGHPLDDVTLRIPAGKYLVTDEAQIPVSSASVGGTTYDLRAGRILRADRFDHAFTELSTVDGRGSAEVRTESGCARLWFDDAFGYLQVFTAEDVAHGVPAIAIEPMSCPADAFNSRDGLIVLSPGEAWTGSWGIEPVAP